MNATALVLEFNARSQPQLELARWLSGRGVNVGHAWNVAGPIVEHDIIILPHLMFDFAGPGTEDPTRAIVHVVFGIEAETPIDLVAWTRDLPGRMFRCLRGCPMIGIDQLVSPASYFAGRPLRVHRSALAWLVAGCAGIVPLDCVGMRNYFEWLPSELHDCRLAAESLAHGRALRDVWAPLPARVRILVPSHAEAA